MGKAMMSKAKYVEQLVEYKRIFEKKVSSGRMGVDRANKFVGKLKDWLTEFEKMEGHR